MNQTALLLLVVALALAVVVLSLALYSSRRRTHDLRRTFGPEYDHALEVEGDRRKAEAELEARRKRVQALDIHPLAAEQRDRFSREWRAAQARFVDEPSQAVAAAARLVKEVMQARGYPVGDFEQRAADLSVDHGNVVTHYRAAREIALANERGQSSTETLRQAMVHYRALFDDLLGAQAEPPQKELAR